ncbi:conserved hypothetical protein [uncultured Desulfobacterium sp.]|uniref:Radical SAM core domain-containing protein n=1 Tax=uncultured Desulfobacterium sp. TaxID=201089 RepID=A0A445MXS7_9BACT|nr:conserved hypothetical protein [uncultured Desulfobacterium sp.]
MHINVLSMEVVGSDQKGECTLPFFVSRSANIFMRLSQYLKTYPYEERPGYLLLLSTRTLSKVLISENTFQSLKEGIFSSPDEAMLTRLGMLVPDLEEEKRGVADRFVRANEQNTTMDIIVVLNLDCNFSCIYCYEASMKGTFHMSESTAYQLVEFIKDRFTDDKKTLLVDFYGGEPLLSLKIIKLIARELKSFAESKGANYQFSLVTNGSLFKRQVAQDLVQLGLKKVKITLDGPAEIHDQYRPFKSGVGSFETIIRNIKETCDLVKIAIGGNFDRRSWDSFPLLLDFMLEQGLTPEKIAMVKFDPITKQPDMHPGPLDYQGGCMSVNEPWIAQTSTLLREEILKRGYQSRPIQPMFCTAESTNSYTVNFDGKIYKCPTFVGKKGYDVGDLEKGVQDYSASYNLGIWKNEKCLECEYLPICYGGCRYMTYLRDRNTLGLDCQKAYFDTCLESLIKQDIKYGLKASAR